jgi:PAS domain S-box-containing protein
VDKTLSGTIVKELMMKDIPYFKDALRFTFLEDLDMPKILQGVENLSHDSVVFLICLLTDNSGNTFSFESSCALISRHSAVPIYSHSDVHLGHGIVGGMLNCGDAQGEMAGEMALRILQGEKVRDIPVIEKSHNRYKFDYQQMERFGIELSSLPKGSTVINRPYSFYSEHKGLIWSVIGGIAGLVWIILILSANIITRRHAEQALRESEEKYRAIFEQAANSILLIDGETGDLVEFNERAPKNLGYTRDELPKLRIPDFEVIESEEEIVRHINKIIEEGTDTFETKHRTKSGRIRDI